MEKPNILFVITDQMRPNAMECAGEPVISPNLDRMAAAGTRFANALSNTPACTPARASLLTGKHVLSHGLVNNDVQLGFEHQSLAKCLTANGYDCGYIGKWHLDGENRTAHIPPGPRRQGFDDYWAGVECNHHYGAGYYYDDATGKPVWFEGYEPDGQTELAQNYVRRKAGGANPFCLFLSWGPPHCPYHLVPRRYLDMYPEDQVVLPENARDAELQDPATIGKESRPAQLAPEERERRKRRIVAQYRAHITAMDAALGRLLHTLEQEGLAENTIVVFTSDHGDMLFSQNRGWKSKPYRESAGVPLLMRWPGHIPHDRVTRAPIGLVDLMPTLLGLAGVPVPHGVEGRDLSALVRGDESAAPDSQFINFPCMPAFFRDEAWRGVVTATHTYVATRQGPWLLFDDVTDPQQMNNLVNQPAHAELQAQLQTQLDAWLKRTHDDFAPAMEIADRYTPGHTGGVLPAKPPLPEIAQGQRARAARVL